MDGDYLERRQVQVSETGVLQMMEISLCQGIPVPSMPTSH